MNWDIIFKSTVTGAGAVVGYLFGGWSIMLQILVTLVAIDYISGVLASFVEGKISSKNGFKGIAKKVMIFCIIAVAHLVDEAFGGTNAISEAVMFFYIGNEVVSIIENSGRIGLPMPTQLTNAVAVLKGKGDVSNGK